MNADAWDRAAFDWLDQLSATSLHRTRRTVRPIDATHVEIDGRPLVNFSSNDYLGLSHHPAVIAACADALRSQGTGAGAAPLVSGQTPLHAQAERQLAAWKGTASAVLLPSGYQANLAAVQVLSAVAAHAGKPIRFLLDKLCHASLVDAVRSSGAAFRVFNHNGVKKLTRLLAEANAEEVQVVVTESIFSMDGDAAPLYALAALKSKYPFLLLVDEAHSSGVYGAGGRGLATELGIPSPADVTVVTLSKAFGCSGGVVCGSHLFCDAVVNLARAYLYTTAVSPVVPAAAIAALTLMEKEPQHQARVRAHAVRLRESVRALGFDLPDGDSPIVPVILHDAENALRAARQLCEAGHFTIAIRPPTVAPNSARLRITLSAMHSEEEIEALVQSLGSLRG